MAGETWRRTAQIGSEVTPGTGVAATRKVYLTDVQLNKPINPGLRRVASGSRSNQVDASAGPILAAGQVSLYVSADELDEWLGITVQGGVSPTTPAGTVRLRTYKPNTADLDSMTLEWHDGARPKRGLGVRGTGLTIAGAVMADNVVMIPLFAMDRDDTLGAMTAALTDRVPSELRGWQTNFYLTSYLGTPGANQITDLLRSWSIVFSGGIGRDWAANNTKIPIGLTSGEIDVTANFTLRAASTAAATAITERLAGTKKLLRCEFLGPVDGIEAGHRRFVTVDIPGVWGEEHGTTEEDGVTLYTLPFHYLYDPTNAFGFQVRTQNARTATYA